MQEGGCRCGFTSLPCVIVLSILSDVSWKDLALELVPSSRPFHSGFLIARVNKALCKFGIVCFCSSGGEATVEMWWRFVRFCIPGANLGNIGSFSPLVWQRVFNFKVSSALIDYSYVCVFVCVCCCISPVLGASLKPTAWRLWSKPESESREFSLTCRLNHKTSGLFLVPEHQLGGCCGLQTSQMSPRPRAPPLWANVWRRSQAANLLKPRIKFKVSVTVLVSFK